MAEEAQEGMRGKDVYVGMGNDKNSKCELERREVQGVSGTCEYGLWQVTQLWSLEQRESVDNACVHSAMLSEVAAHSCACMITIKARVRREERTSFWRMHSSPYLPSDHTYSRHYILIGAPQHKHSSPNTNFTAQHSLPTLGMWKTKHLASQHMPHLSPPMRH